MHIPFVVYDGYFEETERICNLIIDNEDGGRQAGAAIATVISLLVSAVLILLFFFRHYHRQSIRLSVICRLQ